MNEGSNNTDTPDSEKRTLKSGNLIKGIVIGFLIGQLGSIGIGAIYGAALGYYLGTSGLPPEELESFAENLGPFSVTGLVITAIMLGIYFCAGYVCARTSALDTLRSILYLILAMFSFNILFGLATKSFSPEAIFFFSLHAIAIYAGGIYWQKKSHNKRMQTDQPTRYARGLDADAER